MPYGLNPTDRPIYAIQRQTMRELLDQYYKLLGVKSQHLPVDTFVKE